MCGTQLAGGRRAGRLPQPACHTSKSGTSRRPCFPEPHHQPVASVFCTPLPEAGEAAQDWGPPHPHPPLPVDLPQRETQYPLPRVGRALRGHAAALSPGVPLSAAAPPATAQGPGPAEAPSARRPHGQPCSPGGVAAFTALTPSSLWFCFFGFFLYRSWFLCLLLLGCQDRNGGGSPGGTASGHSLPTPEEATAPQGTGAATALGALHRDGLSVPQAGGHRPQHRSMRMPVLPASCPLHTCVVS